MKRWQIVVCAALSVALAQEPLRYQDWFPTRHEEELIQLLEPLLPVPQKTYSMWYGLIPEKDFPMQFAEIPNGIEYFIYPEVPVIESLKHYLESLPAFEQP